MISPIQTSSDKENSGPFGFVCEYCVHANLPLLPKYAACCTWGLPRACCLQVFSCFLTIKMNLFPRIFLQPIGNHCLTGKR